MFNEKHFIEDAKRTEAPAKELTLSPTTFRLLHAATGLSTESGELLDAFKKHLFYGSPLDRVNVLEEAGDLLWYLALLFDALGVSFDDAAKKVIAKLSARYPEKFSQEDAENRDLETERDILEGNPPLEFAPRYRLKEEERREILRLRLEGKSYDEIEEITGRSQGSIGRTLSSYKRKGVL